MEESQRNFWRMWHSSWDRLFWEGEEVFWEQEDACSIIRRWENLSSNWLCTAETEGGVGKGQEEAGRAIWQSKGAFMLIPGALDNSVKRAWKAQRRVLCHLSIKQRTAGEEASPENQGNQRMKKNVPQCFLGSVLDTPSRRVRHDWSNLLAHTVVTWIPE